MEPQLFSCGLAVWCVTCGNMFKYLQWSRNFSVADCNQRPKSRAGQGSSFNGAATFQLRIGDIGECMESKFLAPSMEPQLFSCGLKKKEEKTAPRKKPSMEPQLFSCGLVYANITGLGVQSPFNGAATFQLRIATWFHICQDTSIDLQWSRNFSVADWWIWIIQILEIFLLQWSRNFSVADC